jgi:hypothetical protein
MASPTGITSAMAICGMPRGLWGPLEGLAGRDEEQILSSWPRPTLVGGLTALLGRFATVCATLAYQLGTVGVVSDSIRSAVMG